MYLHYILCMAAYVVAVFLDYVKLCTFQIFFATKKYTIFSLSVLMYGNILGKIVAHIYSIESRNKHLKAKCLPKYQLQYAV